MKGVNYILNDKYEKQAVVIDIETLKEYGDEVEDLLDGIIAESRKGEEKTSLSDLKKELKQTGKL